MSYFLSTLALRNAPLYYFGWVCLAAALGCTVLTQLSRTQVAGANAWIKPLKFFVSITLFVWTMGWYLGYLGALPAVTTYTWVLVGTLTLELLWVSGQAARGQRSHYNVSSPLNAGLSAAMGAVVLILTVGTIYIGLVFCRAPLPDLPPAYAWAIRLSIGLFVVFSCEGGLMISRRTHAVGGPEGGPGLPGVGWSTRHGDLRVAHFVGMHALQVLPLLAWFGGLSMSGTVAVAVLYGGVAVAVLVLALQGRPLGRRVPAAATRLAA